MSFYVRSGMRQGLGREVFGDPWDRLQPIQVGESWEPNWVAVDEKAVAWINASWLNDIKMGSADSVIWKNAPPGAFQEARRAFFLRSVAPPPAVIRPPYPGYVPTDAPPPGYVPTAAPPPGYVPTAAPPPGYVPTAAPPPGYVPTAAPPPGYAPSVAVSSALEGSLPLLLAVAVGAYLLLKRK